MAEIQLKHVYKKYEDKVVAVQDFNLKIKDQEFVIFVGPSGCGKSTTLRMIAGLEEISDGELLIDGKMMNQVQSCDRDIAMVFQNYALYPPAEKGTEKRTQTEGGGSGKDSWARRGSGQKAGRTFGRAEAESGNGTCHCTESKNFPDG